MAPGAAGVRATPGRTAPRVAPLASTRYRWTAVWPEPLRRGFVAVAPAVRILPLSCLPCRSLERFLFVGLDPRPHLGDAGRAPASLAAVSLWPQVLSGPAATESEACRCAAPAPRRAWRRSVPACGHARAGG